MSSSNCKYYWKSYLFINRGGNSKKNEFIFISLCYLTAEQRRPLKLPLLSGFELQNKSNRLFLGSQAITLYPSFKLFRVKFCPGNAAATMCTCVSISNPYCLCHIVKMFIKSSQKPILIHGFQVEIPLVCRFNSKQNLFME